MKPSLLDTDIFSEVLKKRDVVVARCAKRYIAAFSRFTISSVTVMEITEGLHRKRSPSMTARFMNLFDCSLVLDFDRTAAELAGRIAADLSRLGQPIGRADPMIAATAICNGLVLVTANIEHFRRVQGLGFRLELANWRDAGSND